MTGPLREAFPEAIAVVCRLQIWKASREAAGFSKSFPSLRTCRAAQLHGSPMSSALVGLDAPTIDLTYHDFGTNYRRFVRSLAIWPACSDHRRAVEGDQGSIFAYFKPAPLDTLTLGVEPSTNLSGSRL